MNIHSEIDLIKKIAQSALFLNKKIIQGIGDDCAVIDRGEIFELISTDTFVEGDHFRLDWSSPEQIGMKAMEASVSDIAAMGGDPCYVLISLVLRRDVFDAFVEEMYRGIRNVCEKYGISLIGGDTTHGNEISVNVCMIGEVSKKMLRLRSGARVGDILCVSGHLGASTAGLEALRKFGTVDMCLKNKISEYVLEKHLEPRCRLDIASKIARYANAMIDVSDGLGSEVRHICRASGVGAHVYVERIPIFEETQKAAVIVQKNALDFALSGGEDFELVFTISKENLQKLRSGQEEDVYEVGEIVPQAKGCFLVERRMKKFLPTGYDHFRKM